MSYPVLEVHSVRVVPNKFKGANGLIYGEISAVDYGGTTFYIYKVEKERAMPIPKDGLLPLNGPSPCVLNDNLFMKATLTNTHEDLEVTHGHIRLHRETLGTLAARNQPFHIALPGDHGYSVLHISLFEGAVQAFVEVRLVTNGDNIQQPRPSIYGEIFVEYNKYKYDAAYKRKYHRSMLFNVPQDNPIQMSREDEGKIPLSRCAIAVPLDSSVLIHVNLGISSPDTSSQVVNMSYVASFTANSDTKQIITEHIDEKFGRVEVKLTRFQDVLKKAIKEFVMS